MRQRTFLIALAFTIGWCLFSCEDYTVDLKELGGRVEALEDSSMKFFDIDKSIETLMYVAETSGFVSSITEESDGTYIINLKGYFNGSNVLTDSTIVLKMGQKGSELADTFSITKIGDTYYWMFFGELLRDDSGNPVPVEALDGENGTNGLDLDSTNYIKPMLKIATNGYWLISYDGGNTWNNLGHSANGKNGEEEPCIRNFYYEHDEATDQDYIVIIVLIEGIEQTIRLMMEFV